MGDIKSTLTNLTKTVTKTSGGIIKTTKLSILLANEESNLNAIYTDIGKKVHEIYTYGGTLGKVFDEKYANIAEAEKKIQALRAELDMAKGTKTCPHCGKTSARDSGFCPRCGKNMADAPSYSEPLLIENAPPFEHNEVSEPDISISKVSDVSISKRCAVCGAENGETDKFCLSCGRILN